MKSAGGLQQKEIQPSTLIVKVDRAKMQPSILTVDVNMDFKKLKIAVCWR